MLYGEKLKELREDLDLKQADLSKVLKMSKDAYGNYEREFQVIPIKHLNTICEFLNTSFDYVFNLTDKKEYLNHNKDLNLLKIGQRLKEFRKENNLTQVKLAKELNIGNGTIADYERGRYVIATPFLYTICKKYNISADYLLGKIDNPKYL